MVRYSAAPGPHVPRWARHRTPLSGAPLDDLVDLARGGGIVSSLEWDRLTELLAARPHLVVSPRGAWSELAERLLVEMCIADGLDWLHRAESFHRLIAHPVGGEAAIAAAGTAAADRSMQSMIGTLGVFIASSHPAANAVVSRHVVDPVTGRTFYGGLLTSARKLRFGEFSAAQLRAVLPVLVELATSGNGHLSTLGARLVQLLPVGLRHRLPDRLWRVVSEALHPLPTTTARRLGDEARREVAPDTPATDALLPRLVHEMLHDPVFDVRLCTMFLLYSTPYRGPLGRALADELRRRAATGPVEQVRTVLESLRVLGGPAERRLIERLLIAGRAPGPTLDAAAYALGHVGGTSDDPFWAASIARYTDRWTRSRDAHTLSVLDRLVYGIGITDRGPLLHAVVHDPRLPTTIRSAASWWTGLPAHLRASVLRHGPDGTPHDRGAAPPG